MIDDQLVDFFIVSAPKCGTTSIWQYLSHLAGCFMPRKDLHMFGADLEFRSKPMLSEGECWEYFSNAPADCVLGDCSVWYLYSTLAAQEYISTT